MRSTLVCTGCNTAAAPLAEEPLPFHCPAARPGDGIDHVLTRRLDVDPGERVAVGGEENPFLRFRALLGSYQAARAAGLSDERFVEMAAQLDAAVARVDGRGFRITPHRRNDALSDALGFEAGGGVWVKDETGNVSGSHKARHLMGILLHLEIVEALGLMPRDERRPLAIASCGNAALAAAVVAAAGGRRLRVFVPPDAEPAVLERLRALDAEITVCPRSSELPPGDPCYHRFHEAVALGALPFCCQGPDNALTIQGGQTLGYEIAWSGEPPPDRIFIQVGGGALASASAQAFADAAALGALPRVPAIHAVQTRGCAPLARAYERVSTRLGEGISVDEALAQAAAHRASAMWPWEEEPRSAAHGILDDETYDWLAIVRGMLKSGGSPVVVDEETLRRAHALAQGAAGIPACVTGAAGLAGLLAQMEQRPEIRRERVAVLFTGVVRRAPGSATPTAAPR